LETTYYIFLYLSIEFSRCTRSLLTAKFESIIITVNFYKSDNYLIMRKNDISAKLSGITYLK